MNILEDIGLKIPPSIRLYRLFTRLSAIKHPPYAPHKSLRSSCHTIIRPINESTSTEFLGNRQIHFRSRRRYFLEGEGRRRIYSRVVGGIRINLASPRSERDGERNFEGIARSSLSKKEKEENRGGLIASPLDGGRELENPRPHSTWTHGHHVLSVLIRNVISRWVKFWRETWPTRLIGPLRGSPTAAAPIKLGRGRYCDETCHHLDDPSKRGILFPLGRTPKTGIKEKWAEDENSRGVYEKFQYALSRGRWKFIAANARPQSQMRDGRDVWWSGRVALSTFGSMVCWIDGRCSLERFLFFFLFF